MTVAKLTLSGPTRDWQQSRHGLCNTWSLWEVVFQQACMHAPSKAYQWSNTFSERMSLTRATNERKKNCTCIWDWSLMKKRGNCCWSIAQRILLCDEKPTAQHSEWTFASKLIATSASKGIVRGNYSPIKNRKNSVELNHYRQDHTWKCFNC